MKYRIQTIALTAIALLLVGCAAPTSLKQTWKSSAPARPAAKVAVVTVDERGDVRISLENRFVQALEKEGQPAQHLRGFLTFREMKDDREGSAKKLREAGMDLILITRLVDQSTYSSQTTVSSGPQVGGYAWNESYGWYDFFCIAYGAMGVSYGNNTRELYLESSLYDLNTGKHLWSGLTSTVIKRGTDALVEADTIAAVVANAMKKDGFIR